MYAIPPYTCRKIGIKKGLDVLVCSVLVAVWHRMSPTSKRDKERLRQLTLREEQDRITRIMKGIKK